MTDNHDPRQEPSDAADRTESFPQQDSPSDSSAQQPQDSQESAEVGQSAPQSAESEPQPNAGQEEAVADKEYPNPFASKYGYPAHSQADQDFGATQATPQEAADPLDDAVSQDDEPLNDAASYEQPVSHEEAAAPEPAATQDWSTYDAPAGEQSAADEAAYEQPTYDALADEYPVPETSTQGFPAAAAYQEASAAEDAQADPDTPADQDLTQDLESKEEAPVATKTKRRKSRKKVWGITLGLLFVMILIPIGAFITAYVMVNVPEPEELATKQVVDVYANDGETRLARVVPPDGNRTVVSLDEIPEYTRNAVLAAEDREFYTNSGFSVSGFARAALGVITGDSAAGGGSTITQQYVKNTLVGDERSIERKAKELVYSVKMTNEWSKDEVLQAYLNTIYFGRNAYGIDAAAQAYFGVDVQDLTIEQSALIAALIQRPSQLDPWTNRAEAETRWNYVLDGMVSAGWLSADERATLVFPEVWDPAEVNTYTEAEGTNGLIQARVFEELTDLGFTEDEIQTLGLQITTTIDATAQEATVNAVENALQNQMESMRSAVVSVDPATGAVRAYYGGSDPTGYDYANAGLQTGSTFKIFGLAAAVQQGIPTSAAYSSDPYQLDNGEYVTNVGGTSCGTCSLKTALMHSYNTSFMRLQADLENQSQDTADMAHALGVAESIPGVEHTLYEENARPYDGIILGQYQSRVIDMAHALATLANYGVYHDTYFVERITNSSGDVVYERPAAEGTRAVAEDVATNVLDAMSPIAAYSNNSLAGGRTSAVKTGTTQLGDTGYNKDAWMIGATPQLATAVWVGTDNGEPLLTNTGATVYGAGIPGNIWKASMDGALANQPNESFKAASQIGWAHGYTTAYTAPSTQATTTTEAAEDAAGADDAANAQVPTNAATQQQTTVQQPTAAVDAGTNQGAGTDTGGNAGGTGGDAGGAGGGETG